MFYFSLHIILSTSEQWKHWRFFKICFKSLWKNSEKVSISKTLDTHVVHWNIKVSIVIKQIRTFKWTFFLNSINIIETLSN